jgi:hypothetical protein
MRKLHNMWAALGVRKEMRERGGRVGPYMLVNSHVDGLTHGNLDLVWSLIIKLRDLDLHFWN